MTKAFPKNSLWGRAIAANQAEGAYSEDGCGSAAIDVTTGGNVNAPRHMTYTDKDDKSDKAPTMGHNDKIPEDAKYAVLDTEHYPNHVAVDFYHRHKGDIRLFAEVGYSVPRLSISWARIFPDGNDKEPNRAGLDFYRSVFEGCREHSIEPLASIWHFDMPLALEEKHGGWENRKLIDFYVRYCKVIFTERKDLVRYRLTSNEISNTTMFPDMFGAKVSDADCQDGYQVLRHQFVASAKAVQLDHAINSDFMAGDMICGITFYPGTYDSVGILASGRKWESGIHYCCLLYVSPSPRDNDSGDS